MHSLVSLFMLLQMLVLSTSTHDIRYVKPNNYSSINCPSPPCLTLDRYIEERNTYFTTGSTFLFLVGNHSMQTQANLTSISHITLRGKENNLNVYILCTTKVALRCENVTHINVEGLTFLLHFNENNPASALAFLNSKKVTISNAMFQGSENVNKTTAWAVFSNNSDIIITDCLFEGNTGSKGGAITARGGSMMILTGNNFTRNKVGAIHGSRSTLVLKGNEFSNNSGSNGGAIYCSLSSVNLTRYNLFINNHCETKGGAIRLWKGNLSITGDAYFYNNEANSGGAIRLFSSSVMLNGKNISFKSNVAKTNGGGISMESNKNTIKLVLISANFETNRGEHGGAVYIFQEKNVTFVNVHVVGNSKSAMYISDSLVKLNGTNMFLENYGRAIIITCINFLSFSCSTVIFDGNNIIEHNRGALLLESSKIIFNGNTSISNNYERDGIAGAGIFSSSCDIFFMGHTLFYNNSVSRGGVFDIQHQTVSFDGTTEFINNVGVTGSINNLAGTLSFHGNSMFINNTAEVGGVISTAYGTLIFTDTTTFINNTADTGGAIETRQGEIELGGISAFINNTARIGGAIHTAYDIFSFTGTTSFINNTAHEDGGALYLLGTMIILKSMVTFSFNSARNGGAMYLSTTTTLSLASRTNLITSCNRASQYGGAIYHKDNTVTLVQCNYFNSSIEFEQLPYCFLELKTFEPTIDIYSYHNSAGIDGSFIYGGLLDKCRLDRSRSFNMHHGPNTFMNLLNITSQSSATKGIGSEPFQLHLCGSINSYSISTRSMTVTVHRGELFVVPIVALGQGHIITSTTITAVVSNSSRLELSQTTQPLPEHCSNLTYRLYSTKNFEQLILYPNGPCRDTGLARVVINVTLLHCPDGFTQRGAECVCEERLQAYNANCTIGEEMYITRQAGSKFWMSALFRNGSYQGLILYQSCPTEYCKTETVIMTLDHLDTQCDLNRSGVLCGACATNYSLLLGSSQCSLCSNKYLALLLPFALAGIALVAFLTFLKLTVATGMINCLILYANFVQVNRKLFLPINRVNVLTVFIAWLNLDLGFETCFFAGMDAYAQTWLQFAFPIYVWILIGLIILSSRYSITISKLIGSNPIAVLATLLLMSYTKILKIIIEIFSSVNLDYPDGQKVTVWLKDANLPHLQSKHLFLTVGTSLVLVFIFFPYTLLLLLNHKLYRLPYRKYLRWLKPLLDSYCAPYKIHTRYWTGFLLLVRCILYIVFSVNSLGDTSKSLLAIIVTFTGIAIVASGRIYRNFYIDVMEGSTYFNLIILSAGTLAGVNQSALSYTLVGIVFSTMVGIIVYHFHLLYIAKSAAWLTIKSKISSFKKTDSKTPTGSDPPANVTPGLPLKDVSKTVIELREPLLEN